MHLKVKPLKYGLVAFLAPALTLAVAIPFIPSSAQAGQKIAQMGPDFSKLSLSPAQQVQMRRIEADMKPRIMAILNPSQQVQLENKLAQGQTIWQVIPSLDLSRSQRSKFRGVMRSQMPKIFSILTPQQQEQLKRSLPARPPS